MPKPQVFLELQALPDTFMHVLFRCDGRKAEILPYPAVNDQNTHGFLYITQVTLCLHSMFFNIGSGAGVFSDFIL